MPLNTIPNEGLTSRGYPSDRITTPIIINGDMQVAQRGTSQTSITSNGYYTIDRIKTAINNGGTWTQSQSTEVPSGQGFAKSLKMDCTVADTSLASGDFLHLQIPIEAQNLQSLKYGTSSAETLTLSFWVKSNKTGTYCISLQKSDNTRYDFVSEYSISSADTWEKKTITITPDSQIKASAGAIDNDNGEGLKLKYILLSSGRTGTNNTWNSSTPADCTSNQVNLADSTSNEWYITGIQLEIGEFDSTSIPSFPFESFENNLRKCQRYFQFVHSVVGTSDASSNWRGIAPLNPEMRASPSISLTGNYEITDGYSADFTSSDSTSINLITNTGSNKRIFPQIQSFSGLTAGRTYFSPRYHTNDEYIEVDAEL